MYFKKTPLFNIHKQCYVLNNLLQNVIMGHYFPGLFTSVICDSVDDWEDDDDWEIPRRHFRCRLVVGLRIRDMVCTSRKMVRGQS